VEDESGRTVTFEPTVREVVPSVLDHWQEIVDVDPGRRGVEERNEVAVIFRGVAIFGLVENYLPNVGDCCSAARASRSSAERRTSV
jgi:hypothetical protein